MVAIAKIPKNCLCQNFPLWAVEAREALRRFTYDVCLDRLVFLRRRGNPSTYEGRMTDAQRRMASLIVRAQTHVDKARRRSNVR